MRAVIIATGYRPELEPLIGDRPSCLFKLLDKPILVHVLEALKTRHIQQVDIILHHLPEVIEKLINDGRRWGIKATYHLAKDINRPLFPLKPILAASQEDILLATGDGLPLLPKNLEASAPTFFFHNGSWTGWGIFNTKTLVTETQPLTRWPIALHDAHRAEIANFFTAHTFADLHDGNMRLLETPHTDMLLSSSAKQIERGIWLSRGVVLHPSVTLVPPLFIGEHCHINERCRIGPNVVIDHGCVIDANSTISQAMICEHSYVGEALEVVNSIVDRQHLVSLALDTQVTIPDDHLLNDLKKPWLRRAIPHLLERIVALSGLLLLLPVWLPQVLRGRVCKKNVVTLPASPDPAQWQTFSLLTSEDKSKPLKGSQLSSRALQLVNVLQGDAHLVGVSPRTVEELQHLPPDWQSILARGKIGLFTLADLALDKSTEQQYLSEAFYVANMSFLEDLKILVKHLSRSFKDPCRKRQTPRAK